MQGFRDITLGIFGGLIENPQSAKLPLVKLSRGDLHGEVRA
ncbi:MAG TPA: hypothetical protein VFM05_12785 [Candidatus Saccharimonadales bacterium]|nr:hypothetical protein [Candidatus Saccharimonadales bacterium]